VRRRRVVCSHQNSIVRDDYCDRRSKPIEQEWCTTNVSCSTWSLGEWSPVCQTNKLFQSNKFDFFVK
jgi:hypothetical protein